MTATIRPPPVSALLGKALANQDHRLIGCAVAIRSLSPSSTKAAKIPPSRTIKESAMTAIKSGTQAKRST